MHTHDARDVRSTSLARTGMLLSCFLGRTGQPIRLRLSNWTWKQLLNEPIGLEDLKEVDDALHTSLTYAGSDEYDEVGINPCRCSCTAGSCATKPDILCSSTVASE